LRAVDTAGVGGQFSVASRTAEAFRFFNMFDCPQFPGPPEKRSGREKQPSAFTLASLLPVE
jgi:hypothetical protein